jgi:hypothetical protein
MPTYFPPAPDGTPASPFEGAFDSPHLAESRKRLMEHFPADGELEAALGDPDRLITAMADYIWSLGPTESP